MRYPTIEFGAGEVNNRDIDLRTDIRAFPHIDIVSHALDVIIKPGSVSIITSNHFIEHLTPAEQLEWVTTCFHALIPGGAFFCWTPDKEWVLTTTTITDEWREKLLAGKGDYAENVHLGLLTQSAMKELLTDAGFHSGNISIREVGGSIEVIAFKEKKRDASEDTD